jgi:TonB family protein
MNAAATTVTAWSRQRWVWTVLLVFSLQGSLFWMLSDTTPGTERRPGSGPTLYLIAGTPAEAQLHDSLVLGDPTFYSLANRRGFSGAVWRDFLRPRLHLGDWREPDRWLAPRLDTLTATFTSFVRSNAFPTLAIAETPPTRLDRIPVTADLLAVESTLRIDGPLAGRRLMTSITLETWPAGEWVTNTVVQLAVNAAGEPVSVVLLERSGSKAADQRALELARTARFAPLPGEPLPPPLAMAPRTWGELVFQWQVHAPPAGPTIEPKR